MKRLMTLVAAAGALAGVQALAASPAAAWGYCSPYNPYYGYYYYGYSYYAPACCGVVRWYRPVVRRAVRTVRYYRVVGYRPAYYYRRPCCW
jgi:hypothetical protein